MNRRATKPPPNPPWWPLARDVAMFVSGLGVIFFLLLTGDKREFMAVAALGLVGTPAFLRRDEKGD